MAAYSLLISRSAEKEIDGLPAQVRRLLVHRILALAESARPHGSQKLAGQNSYRIRQGEYRVVHTIADSDLTITVVRVAHRREAYR